LSRMRAVLSEGRSITVSSDETTLFTYGYGTEQPGLTGGLLPSRINWLPPLADPGDAMHLAFTELTSTPATATIAHHLSWPAVDEWRSLTTSVAGGEWVLLFENTITNVTGRPLPLAGPSLTLPALTTPLAGRVEWQAAHSTAATVVVVDDAANPHHPPRWSGLSPAPFSAAGVTLNQDQTIAFRYAVIVAPAARHAPTLAARGRAALTGELPVRAEVCAGERAGRKRTRSPGSIPPATHRPGPNGRPRYEPRWP
jgi:hypothetical protein